MNDLLYPSPNDAANEVMRAALLAQRVSVVDAADRTEAMVALLGVPVDSSTWAGPARAAYDGALDHLRASLAGVASLLRTAGAETSRSLATLAAAAAAAGAAAGADPSRR